MRLFLISCVLVLTGLTFFVAAQRMMNSSEIVNDQDVIAAIAVLRSDEEAARATLEAEIAQNLSIISDLEARDAAQSRDFQTVVTEKSQLQSELDATLAQLASVEQGRDTIEQQRADLEVQVARLNMQIAATTENLTQAEAALASVSKTAEEREAIVTALEAQMSDLQANADASAQRIASLESADVPEETVTDTSDTQIAELELGVRQQVEAIAASTSQDDYAQAATEVETKVAALTTPKPALPSFVPQAGASGEDSSESTAVPELVIVTECNARTNAVFAQQQITFVDGTDAIAASSAAVLEALADVAVECAQNDLIVTIGVHAESEADNAGNIALSDNRAAALRNFLGARGLAADAMSVADYDESLLIAVDGGISDQGATFVWQQR